MAWPAKADRAAAGSPFNSVAGVGRSTNTTRCRWPRPGWPIAIFAGLLVCDPFLAHLSSGIIIPAVLVLCMAGMYFYFHSLIKERDARP
jgi:hypothetical protein